MTQLMADVIQARLTDHSNEDSLTTISMPDLPPNIAPVPCPLKEKVVSRHKTRFSIQQCTCTVPPVKYIY